MVSAAELIHSRSWLERFQLDIDLLLLLLLLGLGL